MVHLLTYGCQQIIIISDTHTADIIINYWEETEYNGSMLSIDAYFAVFGLDVADFKGT